MHSASPSIPVSPASIHLADWITDARRDSCAVRAFVMRLSCPACDEPGWALFLLTAYGTLIADAELIFPYPGIRRQLNAFLASRPGIAGEFGRVKHRFPKGQRSGRGFLSQGCWHPKCDIAWSDILMRGTSRGYFAERGGEIETGVNDMRLKQAFVVELERVMEG